MSYLQNIPMILATSETLLEFRFSKDIKPRFDIPMELLARITKEVSSPTRNELLRNIPGVVKTLET